jgi:ribose 1,5-bisphosphokinase PhnN
MSSIPFFAIAGTSTSLGDCEEIEHPRTGVPDFFSALRALLPEERKEVTDIAVINGILRVDSEIQRNALAMRGASSSKILKKLTAMLHAWQQQLNDSLPNLLTDGNKGSEPTEN